MKPVSARPKLRRIVLVEADVDGIISAGASPPPAKARSIILYETATAWLILRDYLWPMVKGREFACASEDLGLFSPSAATTWPRRRSSPPFGTPKPSRRASRSGNFIGGTLEEIPCGVSIGIQATLPELFATVEKELAAGYQRIKIKIKPGKDIDPVARCASVSRASA